jgi:hypothetical protein
MTPDLLAFVRVLPGAGVDFIIVGGVAAGIHGVLWTTVDLDLVYDRFDLRVSMTGHSGSPRRDARSVSASARAVAEKAAERLLEGLELRQLLLQLLELRPQQIPHLPAPFYAPLLLIADEIADLVQREAERLRLLDEAQAFKSGFGIQPEAADGPRGFGQQAEALVVAQRVGRHPAAGRELANLVSLTRCAPRHDIYSSTAAAAATRFTASVTSLRQHTPRGFRTSQAQRSALICARTRATASDVPVRSTSFRMSPSFSPKQ